jgi:hypothetical protein
MDKKKDKAKKVNEENRNGCLRNNVSEQNVLF